MSTVTFKEIDEGCDFTTDGLLWDKWVKVSRDRAVPIDGDGEPLIAGYYEFDLDEEVIDPYL